MSMTAYKLLNSIVRLAEGCSATEGVNWRGLQRVSDCLDKAGTHPMGSNQLSNGDVGTNSVSILRTNIQSLTPGRIFSAPPEHFCA